MSRRRYRALWSPREGIEVFVDTSEPGVVFVDWIRYRRTKVPGPAASAPRPPQEFMAICWMVMRSTGRRPQVRHQTLDEAQVEAARIAASSPGIEVWILEARTIDTVQAPVAAPVSEILP